MRAFSWWRALAMVVAVAGCAENTGPEVELEESEGLAAITNLTFAQISAGSSHSCGRTAVGGRLYCWGYNSSGQLGNASRNDKKRPTPASSTLAFKWVSSGPGHTCAISTADDAYCWGSNAYGQVGDASTTERWSPTLVGGGLKWSQIEVGGYDSYSGFTCGITTGGRLYCWGANYYGQLGFGYTDWAAHYWPDLSNSGVTFRQLAVGGGHACAVSSASAAYCWGEADYGQTGNGGIFHSPTAVSGGLAFRQVTAGNSHTCGTTTGNRGYCWGNGYYGGIGDGTTTNRFAPRAVSGSLGFSRVFAGIYHTCGVTTGRKAYCWGTNGTGQLGDGTTTRRLRPAAVASTLSFAQLGTRGTHTCGVQRDTGVGYCWGDNSYGQVGDATTTQRLRPTRVAGAL
jgi:alpha-tubulin suppressor-like RCC1 family protein